MVNKSKWIYNYNNLDPDDQLEAAEAITNELKDNEIFLDEDEYDKEKSRIVREFFNSIKCNKKKAEELKKFSDIFERFESLSQNNKGKVINDIFEIVAKYICTQEQENKEKVCEHEGHIFDEWKCNKWTEYIDTIIDHEHVHDYPIKYENWKRTCSRCGFVEEVDRKPQELINGRKEKNKKAQIKKLESKLKKLKNE